MAKKRANGEGSVYKRKDGRYEAKIQKGWTPEGRPKYRYFSGTSQAKVLEQWSAAKGEIRTGNYVEPNKILFKSWLDTWLNVIMKNSLKGTTYLQHKGLIENYIVPEIGGIKLVNLQTVHIQELYNKKQVSGRLDKKTDKTTNKRALKEGGLSPKTIRIMHQIISSSLKQAIRESYIQKNPADAVKLPRVSQKEMKVLNVIEAKKLIEVAMTHKYYVAYYPLYLVELYTGLRRGELLGLRWKDIDFKEGKLHVIQQVVSVGGNHIIRDLKTESSKRIIMIPEEIVEALKDHRKKETEKFKLLGWDDVQIKKHLKDGLVFTNMEGRLLRTERLRKNFNSLLKTCGIQQIRFHDMRHTFAVLSLQQGVDIKTLQNDMGHESIETTLDNYGHANELMKRDAAQKRSNLLKDAVEK